MICPEPTGLQIVNGCRGIIELSFSVLGKTAHAGTPNKGVNSIVQAVKLTEILNKNLTKRLLKDLGKTTVNLASLQGGININNEIKIQANSVPNIAKVLVDIRTSDPEINAEFVFNKIGLIAKRLHIKIEKKKINLDYQSYLIAKNNLRLLENAIGKVIAESIYIKDRSSIGFFESALIYKKWNVPSVSFGPKGVCHSENEYVDIKSLITTRKIFECLIKKFIN